MDPDYVDQLVQRGLISDDVAARLTGGEPQRQSRFDILRQGLDAAKDYLTPGYFRDTPSSPQADRALADPNARPGKIGPPSGPPTGMQIAGGLAGDVGLNALPIGKFAPELATIPFWLKPGTGPRMAARADALREAGHGLQHIADDLEVGKASVGRYFQQSGQKTAAAENRVTGVLGDLGNDEVIKAGLAQGDSYATIAQRIGTTPGNVWQRTVRLRKAGGVPEYVERDPSFWDPEGAPRRARLVGLANQQYSLREMARDKQLGATSAGQISGWIRGMQERHGELLDWAPQGATGVTAAGRTPTLAKTKSQTRPIHAEDLKFGQDFAKALSAFTQDGPQR